MSTIRKFLNEDDAVTSVEYAIILTLIAGACIFVILAVGLAAGGMWGDSATDLGDTFSEIGVGQ